MRPSAGPGPVGERGPDRILGPQPQPRLDERRVAGKTESDRSQVGLGGEDDTGSKVEACGAGHQSDLDHTACRLRRPQTDAGEREELAPVALGNPVHPVDQLLHEPGEQLDQHDPRVVDVVVRPPGAQSGNRARPSSTRSAQRRVSRLGRGSGIVMSSREPAAEGGRRRRPSDPRARRPARRRGRPRPEARAPPPSRRLDPFERGATSDATRRGRTASLGPPGRRSAVKEPGQLPPHRVARLAGERRCRGLMMTSALTGK